MFYIYFSNFNTVLFKLDNNGKCLISLDSLDRFVLKYKYYRDCVTYTIQFCAHPDIASPVPGACVTFYFYKFIYLFWRFDPVNLWRTQEEYFFSYLRNKHLTVEES